MVDISIKWDAHSCLPLNPRVTLDTLEKHRQAGFNYISINIGMDMNPLSQILSVIANFRHKIQNSTNFALVDNSADISKIIAQGKCAITFDLEGAVCLQNDPAMVEIFYQLGIRQIHLAYNQDNALAGGCHGNDIGISPIGKTVIRAMEQCGVVIDVSHTGYRSSMDIFDYAQSPVVFSHTNPQNKSKHPRTITKEQAVACANTGGVIGITGISAFLDDSEVKSSTFANHIETMVDWVGIDSVGIGLDYSYSEAGLCEIPAEQNLEQWWPKQYGYSFTNDIKTSCCEPYQVGEAMQILSDKGYSHQDIAKIWGGNFHRVAKSVW